MKIEHILVTTDLSSDALRACAPVAELAQSMGARITLLHVVPDLLAMPHGAALASPMSMPSLEDDMEDARPILEEQRSVFGADVEVATEVISGSNTARSIAGYAEQNGVDLIALSTHGRTGFRHLALGSVAEAVLRHAPVPVLVFPPRDEDRPEA